jgi:molybdate transport system substrate-binding protein
VRRLVAAAATLAFVAGCGDDGGDQPRLVVSAATSLKAAFEDYRRALDDAEVRFSFAGSDQLAGQIRQGAKPDVYAAANSQLPRELSDEGLVERPVAFATNELVLAVPAGSDKVRALDDLTSAGVDLVMGSETVPVGSYTREVLERLPVGERDAILANVRSNEPDVGGIVGKLTQGAADAGFIYATDVQAAGGKLEAIDLDPGLEPVVIYEAAVVKGAERPDEARAFIEGLLEGEGRHSLVRAGFRSP